MAHQEVVPRQVWDHEDREDALDRWFDAFFNDLMIYNSEPEVVALVAGQLARWADDRSRQRSAAFEAYYTEYWARKPVGLVTTKESGPAPAEA